STVQQIDLAEADRATRADRVIEIEACPQDRRIADASGNLVTEPRRRGHTTEVSMSIKRRAVDRAVNGFFDQVAHDRVKLGEWNRDAGVAPQPVLFPGEPRLTRCIG